jgi:Putative adhesin
MKAWIPATIMIAALGSLPALAAEQTFERTLSVSGVVTLHVSTGSGNIHIETGSDNQVHVFGRVKSSWGANEDRVRDIANNPPIEQTGSILRIGGHMENMHNISIDYEIKAPAKAILEASSGSGDVTDRGVGVNARLNTGSGNIHAEGLQESFSVETGSGNIYAEQIGSGDVKADTGSGNIELKNLNGSLKAQTGSGDIKLNGQPKDAWRVTTGSGNVDMWADRSAFNLEASTGSGDIHSDHEMSVQGSFSKHHISGKINGGGPTVRVETGSGDIRVH